MQERRPYFPHHQHVDQRRKVVADSASEKVAVDLVLKDFSATPYAYEKHWIQGMNQRLYCWVRRRQKMWLLFSHKS